MGKVELQVGTWQERGIQVMVLLSFTMQLMLLVLAEFRRRIDSGMLRALVWSAYMMADSTATYTLGHLSVTSRSSDHQLMAFWAPFLLLHLGGQDNINAYAIEDNRLWLRHLQALIVQVAAAAYVLYESTVIGSHVLLRNATVLMFVVGIAKYGERVWALKRAGTSAVGHNYQQYSRSFNSSAGHPTNRRDTEGLLQIAHHTLAVPKNLLQGPFPSVGIVFISISADELYKVIEMQLSLMHDVIYSKAEVIHTWYGLCIRVISPMFTVVAFLLFHRSGLLLGNHYSKSDIAITYVLLGGAVMLEIVSVLRAMFSRWPSVILGMLAYDEFAKERRMWGFLACAITSIRRYIIPERVGSRWWWSCSKGQHNMLNLCIRSRASRASRIAGWMGVEDWWNTLVYSRFIPVSATIKELVVKQVRRSSPGKERGYYSKSTDEEADHIINSQGRAALKNWSSYERLGRFVDMELDESILVWHIATDIYLRWVKGQKQVAVDDVCRLAEATEAISNYMLFLLAARPYMLPDSISRTRYVDMCYFLTSLKYNTAQDLASLLTEDGHWKYLRSERMGEFICYDNRKLEAAQELAQELVSSRFSTLVSLEMIAEVWTEMLCYAGYRCSGYSHVKQLSNGGELLTVAALVVEYYRRDVLKPWSRAERKEEEARQAAILGAAGDGEIIDVPAWLWLDEPRSTSSECNDEISPV